MAGVLSGTRKDRQGGEYNGICSTQESNQLWHLNMQPRYAMRHNELITSLIVVTNRNFIFQAHEDAATRTPAYFPGTNRAFTALTSYRNNEASGLKSCNLGHWNISFCNGGQSRRRSSARTFGHSSSVGGMMMKTSI
jgi:hypothetical protein